jgi:hypothetical protein
LPRLLVGRQPALDASHEPLKLVRRIRNLLDTTEVNPGKILEKIERKIAAGLREDHRYDAEVRLTGLANNGQFALVLLSVAEAVRSDRTIADLAAPIAFSRARTQGRPGSRLRRSKNDFSPFAHRAESISFAWSESARE